VVVVDEAGEELVLVGVAEGVILPLVLHELLGALEDEIEVVLQLELVHAPLPPRRLVTPTANPRSE
jgi:hypothetical protein